MLFYRLWFIGNFAISFTICARDGDLFLKGSHFYLNLLVFMEEPLSWRSLPPIQLRRVGRNGHQWPPSLFRKTLTEFPAQKTTLQLIIMTTLGCFAAEQRKNAYYRNDPIKYGLVLLSLCDGDHSKCYFIACGLSAILQYLLQYVLEKEISF